MDIRENLLYMRSLDYLIFKGDNKNFLFPISNEVMFLCIMNYWNENMIF